MTFAQLFERASAAGLRCDRVDYEEAEPAGDVIAVRMHFGPFQIFADRFFGVYAIAPDATVPCRSVDEAVARVTAWCKEHPPEPPEPPQIRSRQTTWPCPACPGDMPLDARVCPHCGAMA